MKSVDMEKRVEKESHIPFFSKYDFISRDFSKELLHFGEKLSTTELLEKCIYEVVM